MIKFKQDFKAKDINNENYTGKIIGYSNKVLINCKDNKNNIFQNLILFFRFKKHYFFQIMQIFI